MKTFLRKFLTSKSLVLVTPIFLILWLTIAVVPSSSTPIAHAQPALPISGEQDIETEPPISKGPAPQPLIMQETISQVEISFKSDEELQKLQSLGFLCYPDNVCMLNLDDDEITTLKTTGVKFRILAGVVKLSSQSPAEPDAVTDDSRYAANYTDYLIPDYDDESGDIGYTWSWVNISGAPTSAYVTSIQYTVMVPHTYPGDLVLAFSNNQSATRDTIWDRLGSTDDGGFDDDSENDEDIFLSQRTSYSTFDGNEVNGNWYLEAWDHGSVDIGYIDYFQLWVYYVVPPANDDFNNAFVISSLPYSNTQSTANATSASDDPATSCSNDYGRSVWYRFTATNDSLVRFETAGSSHDTWMAIYTGTRGNLTEVACNDDYPDIGLDSRVDLQVSDSTIYYLWFGGDDNDFGTLILSATSLCSSPGTPGLVSPNNGITTNDNTPTFDWNSASSSDEYQIQVDNNSNFSSPNVNTTTSSTLYTPGSGLSDGTYYWRVRGHNTGSGCDVYGSWSSTRSLTIDTTSPGNPNLVSPSNESTFDDSTPLFDWNTVSDTVEYQLQVDNSSSFSSPNIDITTGSSSYTPSSSLGDGTYYWRVRARDAAGNWGNWSTMWSFTIDTSPTCNTPGTASLVSPGNGSTTSDNTPTFDWNSTSSSDEYQIQVDNNSNFSSTNINTTTSNTVYTLGSGLGDDIYYWRVRGHNTSNGCDVYGSWSSVWNVTIDTGPTCYVLSRNHSGSGSDPTASPVSSAGCENGHYIADESISLTANPSSGWFVSSWSGTNNNSSTSTSNSVTMPSGNHTVSVNYAQQPTIQFSSTSYSINEGDGTAIITVQLNAPSIQTVTVNYTTSNGTAIAGSDYIAQSSVLTFSPGVSSQTFNISIIDDALDESNESVNLTLSNPTNGSLGSPTSSVLNIIDNDGEPTVQFSGSSYNVVEGNEETITVLLSQASAQTISVNYAMTGGTATLGSDFLLTGDTLLFNPGQTSKTFNVSTLDDVLVEENETIILELSNVSNAALGVPSFATLSITDNDNEPGEMFIIYMPAIQNKFVSYFEGPFEHEPNNRTYAANGSIISNRLYLGTFPATPATDPDSPANFDYFSLCLTAAHNIEVWLSSVPVNSDYNFAIRDANGTIVADGYSADPGDDYVKTSVLPPGIYYIQVINHSGPGSNQSYRLRVLYE